MVEAVKAKKPPRKKKGKPGYFNIAGLVPYYRHDSHGGKGKDSDAKVNGEPSWILLRRFEYDKTLHGQIWNECCGCGLVHLYTYNVVSQPDGTWWLVKRSYGDGTTQPKKVVRAKGKKP